MSASFAQLFASLNQLVTNDFRSSQNSSVMIEYSSIFKKPSDVMQYSVEKARQKFNKSVEVIRRLESIKAEDKRRAESKVRRSEEREYKLKQEFSKRSVEHSKHTLSTVEYRQKILEKKKQMTQKLDQEFHNYGTQLNKRMHKLSKANQSKLKEIVQKQYEKMKSRIHSDYSKVIQDEVQLKLQAKEIESSMQELENRISSRLRSYESNIKQRVSNAREKNERVTRIFSKSLSDYHKKSEERLVKVIRKSLIGDEKKSKKQENYSKYSNDLKTSAQKSFMRNSKGLEGLSDLEIQRIRNIENRVSNKTKIFNELKNKFEVAIREKKQKNSNRFESHGVQYSKALESQAQFRMKVIDRHQKIFNLAEEIKTQKFELANRKRIDNFEIQKMRSSFSTDRKRFDSRTRCDTVI